MKVVAIIPTLEKNKEYLRLCVESLRKTTDWDIIVVSNGTEKQPDYTDINGISSHVHVPDQGQCRAVNIGAQKASDMADYLFICNDDMYFASGWNLLINYDNLVFSPNLIEPTNNAGSAKPFLKLDAGFTLSEFKPELVDNFIANTVPQKEEPGFNFPLFVRKDVWDTIGGYDENYDPWGSNSDSDLQTKLELAGITPMRLRDVLVYHFSNKSGTFDFSEDPLRQQFYQQNFEYYKGKWGFDRADGDAPWYGGMVDWDNLQFKPRWIDKYKVMQ